MLTCSIVYATPHTNARRLAESMIAVVGSQCIYMGLLDPAALAADVIFWGCNTDTQTPEMEKFLRKAEGKIVVPYGHLCKGGGKDLYAIGEYASNVMFNAERVLQEIREKEKKMEAING
jgi:hypothetical protein